MFSSLPAVTVTELAAIVAADPSTPVIDVREPAEYAAGHLPSAELIPMSVVPVRVRDIAKGRTVYLVCRSGARSAQTAVWLNQQGFDTVNVTGGTDAWIDAGLPVST